MNILVGVCARQHPRIFAEFLRSLFSLDVAGLCVRHHFIFHNWPEGRLLAQPYADRSAGLTLETYTSDTTYLVDERRHHWTTALICDVARMKNRIIRTALRDRYDGVFLVDSDLILHPDTLRRLCQTQREVVAQVFWTRWRPDQPALPNAWDFDQYGFAKDSLARYARPGLYRVGGAGACILIRSTAIERGLDYRAVPSVSWLGEDRAMQLRAAVLGIPIYLDTHRPAYHIYRKADLKGLDDWRRRQEAAQPL